MAKFYLEVRHYAVYILFIEGGDEPPREPNQEGREPNPDGREEGPSVQSDADELGAKPYDEASKSHADYTDRV